MKFFTRQYRSLLLAAVLAVGSLCLSGCGGGGGGTDLGADPGTPPGTGPGTDPGTAPGVGGGSGSGDFVTIGGVKWMNKNLDIETADSWCYGEGGGQLYVDMALTTLSPSEVQDMCSKRGRLYTWSAAKAACQSIGKRLPTALEWQRLVDAVGGSATALKSATDWYKDGNGTDQYGFSALPGGNRFNGLFDHAGDCGYWWAASEDGSYAYCRTMLYNYDVVGEYAIDTRQGNFAFSVRCIAD